MRLTAVSVETYRLALAMARANSDNVRQATSAPEEIPDHGRFFVSDDGLSGFGVLFTGELVGLFSLIPGRGDALTSAAVESGATWGNCFEIPHLLDLYGRHGFAVYERQANWDPEDARGDVVFFSRLA